MRMCSFRALKIARMLAGFGILGMILASAPLHGQGAITEPGKQEPSVETKVAPPAEPAQSGVSLAEGLPAKSPEPFVGRERVLEALLKENFVYDQNKMVDPFVSFISPATSAPAPVTPNEEEFEPPPEPQRPLTPLQKMNLGEIEKGLKAIVWGEFGRRALVEDSAGKGYIVSVGTPAGERDGVITDIFNDRIVIQQQIWDRKAKRMMPQNFVVKLKKQPAT
jgi:Tfp pilus assembly protein PilP